MMHGQRNIKFY